jgi:hypothetical protein
MKKLTVVLSMLALLGTSAAFAQAKKKPVAPAKTVICHKANGKSKTMKVAASDVSGHLAHGDQQGACH